MIPSIIEWKRFGRMGISDWRMSMSFWEGSHPMNEGSRGSEEIVITSNTRVSTPIYGTSSIRIMVVEIKSSKKLLDGRKINKSRKTMKNLN